MYKKQNPSQIEKGFFIFLAKDNLLEFRNMREAAILRFRVAFLYKLWNQRKEEKLLSFVVASVRDCTNILGALLALSKEYLLCKRYNMLLLPSLFYLSKREYFNRGSRQHAKQLILYVTILFDECLIEWKLLPTLFSRLFEHLLLCGRAFPSPLLPLFFPLQ